LSWRRQTIQLCDNDRTLEPGGISKSRGGFGAAEQRLRHSCARLHRGDDPELLRIAAAGLAFRWLFFLINPGGR
jgi:hypothetical protein